MIIYLFIGVGGLKIGFVQVMFTEEYYVCCVWIGLLGEEGVGLNGEVLSGFELLAFIIVLYLFIYLLGGSSEGMKCG